MYSLAVFNLDRGGGIQERVMGVVGGFVGG